MDVGCGNGFISQYLLKSADFSDINKVTLLDAEQDCVDCAQSWITDPRAEFVCRAGQVELSRLLLSNSIEDQLDLVVCNPPYVPHFNRSEPTKYRTFKSPGSEFHAASGDIAMYLSIYIYLMSAELGHILHTFHYTFAYIYIYIYIYNPNDNPLYI